ncbi:MAG: hypothetical protein ABMB14_20195 [Myxococcota bacterium]
MVDDPLDALPLELLLALIDAAGDPSDAGRLRAASRARDAGYHVELVGGPVSVGIPRYDPEPIPMEEASDGVESLRLRFDRPRSD